jgi:Family of unknown function (DUF5990)
VRRDTGGLDFSGPFVHGDRTDRHFGLTWGEVPGDGTLRLFRGAKLRLVDVDPSLVEEAMRPGRRLVARIRLTDPPGEPGLRPRASPGPHLVGGTGSAAIWLEAQLGSGPAGRDRAAGVRPAQLSRSATAATAGAMARSPTLPKPMTSAGGAAASAVPR